MTVQVFQVDPHIRFMPYTQERESIEALGASLVMGDCQTDDDLIAQAQDAEILLISWSYLLTPKAMDALPNLRFVARWGVGYDMIDVDSCTERGIAVANAPTYCADEVAEHAITLLMAVARRLVWAHERMRDREWTPFLGSIHRIKGQTLGIVGCGSIGSKVAARAQGLGLNVIAYDKYRSADSLRAIGVEPVSFDELLARSDYVTLHTPLNAETRHMINAEVLAKMQPESMLINTSRGGVVDQEALIAALESGHLAGAGLDVFDGEPLAADSPLRSLEHVVLTPHAAAFSIESIEELRVEMVETITDWITTGWSKAIVNPEVRSHLRPQVERVGD